MNIGLDYDDTYTRDPIAWTEFIKMMQMRGHNIYLVTWRFVQEVDDGIRKLDKILDGVYFTGRKAKEKYMFDKGINIHVWVDDNPRAITQSMQGHE
jgi:acid phosphatase class B